MNKLSLDQIKFLADSVLRERPSTVPGWAWELPCVQSPRTYYAFLHALVRAVQPEFIVELGTDQGTSAAFLATATDVQVVSVDCDARATNRVREIAKTHGLTNLVGYCDDTISPEAIATIQSYGKQIGMLFVDTEHSFAHISKETRAYFPLMVEGGIVAYDDIHINDEMSLFWARLDKPKIEILQPYWAGFGVSIA